MNRTATPAASGLEDAVQMLRCPVCLRPLDLERSADGSARAMACRACSRAYPVRDGIPRFTDAPDDPIARRTQASFGYEWSHFSDWKPSGDVNFQDYFRGLDLTSLRHAQVLDAGCGMGRHARQIAPYVARVVAVDFSRAIDQAARNTASLANVTCVQADVLALPVAPDTFDFVYSLGVLHHVADTSRALAALADKIRPGGRLRVYLYWKRHGLAGGILWLVTQVRRISVRLPHGLLRGLCWILSLVLYGTVILPFRALHRLGVRRHQDWPLMVYTKYPFAVLYNDQFDRFSAPLEKRYEANEVRQLLEHAGLRDVRVFACYGWVAEGTKPLAPGGGS